MRHPLLLSLCALTLAGAVACKTSPRDANPSGERLIEHTKKAKARAEELVPINPQALEQASLMWSQLGQAQMVCEDIFNYGLEGGIVVVSCHLASLGQLGEVVAREGFKSGVLSYAKSISGMPVYLSGPHQESMALLSEQGVHESFGHYNPRFVEWFLAHAIPASQNEPLLILTQPFYDTYFRQTAHTFDRVYETMAEREDCYALQRDAYVESMQDGVYHNREDWSAWLVPDFCASPSRPTYDLLTEVHDPNVMRDALGFWMRRDLDGTAKQWHAGLKQLRATYER